MEENILTPKEKKRGKCSWNEYTFFGTLSYPTQHRFLFITLIQNQVSQVSAGKQASK